MTEPKKGSFAQGILLAVTVIIVFALQAISTMSHHSTQANREPSSVQQSSIPDLITENRTFTVPINCEEFSQAEQKSKYPFVRITSDSCSTKKANEVLMTNLTNGVDATVFQLSKGFTSDLIRLRPGKNRILVIEKFENEKDQRRTLTIVSH